MNSGCGGLAVTYLLAVLLLDSFHLRLVVVLADLPQREIGSKVPTCFLSLVPSLSNLPEHLLGNRARYSARYSLTWLQGASVLEEWD